MGRQDRRRRLRETGPKRKWDMIIIYAFLALLLGTAAFSYLFPQINARAYASGPRVQRIIINKGIDQVLKKPSLEFMYSYSAATAEDTVQYQAFEAAGKVTLIDSETKESAEYAANTVPADYRTVSSTLNEIRAAAKDKNFKIIYPEGENNYYYVLRVVNQQTPKDIEGFDLYFTAQHELDIVHYYKTMGEDEVLQRVYSGLTTGIVSPEPESPED